MSIEKHGILGQTTDYPKTYSPNILFPISRQLGREKLKLTAEKLKNGVDYWHCFELSWLNYFGVSQVAMARIIIPANSPNIVESKSLKLYLNGFNFTEFESKQAVANTIKQDLSNCVGANVQVEIFELDDETLLIDYPNAICIDDAITKKINVTNDVESGLLLDDGFCNHQMIEQSYYSNLLRSNCPVTNQPDWGVVQIDIKCGQLNVVNLLEYILSYRNHNGFHEQCVEQIFSDLTMIYEPQSLMVRAWYTRRGGIDINPIRVSDMRLMPTLSRLIRQ